MVQFLPRMRYLAELVFWVLEIMRHKIPSKGSATMAITDNPNVRWVLEGSKEYALLSQAGWEANREPMVVDGNIWIKMERDPNE